MKTGSFKEDKMAATYDNFFADHTTNEVEASAPMEPVLNLLNFLSTTQKYQRINQQAFNIAIKLILELELTNKDN